MVSMPTANPTNTTALRSGGIIIFDGEVSIEEATFEQIYGEHGAVEVHGGSVTLLRFQLQYYYLAYRAYLNPLDTLLSHLLYFGFLIYLLNDLLHSYLTYCFRPYAFTYWPTYAYTLRTYLLTLRMYLRTYLYNVLTGLLTYLLACLAD